MKGTRMKNKVLALLGVLTVVLVFAFVAQPMGFVPMFDADLRRLAMSLHESHCAAEGFMVSTSTSAETAAECRETDGRSTEIDLEGVTPEFCLYISEVITTLEYNRCVSIMYENQYWHTYDGHMTNAWNRTAPYPLSQLFSDSGDQRDTGRTGDREEIQRLN